MASQGPLYPANMANGAGARPWTSPESAVAEDGSYAIANAGGTSNQLIALDFGFTIPEDSTIDGILVEIKRGATLQTGDEYFEDYELFMEEDGSFTLNFAEPGSWDTSVDWHSYGGPTDLLGIDDYLGDSYATPDDVNYQGWGMSIRVAGAGVVVQALVDAIRITVYYTPPPPPTYILTDFSSRQDRAMSLLVQPDGKIVLGGWSYDIDFDFNRDFAIARFLTNGTLDSSFGTGGKVITTLFQPGVVTSTTNTTPIVITTAEPHGLTTGMAVTVGGCVNNGNAGGPFPNGANGTFTIEVLSDTTFALPIDEPPVAPAGAEADAHWSRFGNADTQSNVGRGSGLMALALQDDDKIIAVGFIASSNLNTAEAQQLLVMRFNDDGSMDTGFGDGGVIMTHYGSPTYGKAVVVQDDGKILVGGDVYPAAQASAFCARFNTDGTPDTGFGTAGVTITDFGGTWETGFVLAVRPTGEILFGGDYQPGTNLSNARTYLAQLDEDGVLDTSFGTSGVTTFEFGLVPNSRLRGNPFAIHIDDSGKVLLGGWYQKNDFIEKMAVIQFNADGSIDTGFGDSPGWTETNISGLSEIYALTVQDDGKILVAGGGNAGGTGLLVLRYDASGTLDAGFGTAGITTELLNSGQATGIAVLESGNIVVGGWANPGSDPIDDDFYLQLLNSSGEPIEFPSGSELNIAADCVATATITCSITNIKHIAADLVATSIVTCDVTKLVVAACVQEWTSDTKYVIEWTSNITVVEWTSCMPVIEWVSCTPYLIEWTSNTTGTIEWTSTC